MHRDTNFRNGSRAETKWPETTPIMSFGPNVVHRAIFIPKKQEMVPGQKLMPCMHPDTSFRNGSRATRKWRETTPNMSFGPKLVDWACSLRKNKKCFRGHKLMPVGTPILVFAMAHVRQRNGAKPLQTRVLDLNFWIWHGRCEKRRNGSRGTNSYRVCTQIPIFAMGHVRQRNCAKPPQT